jgi:hypothetical protein
VNNPRQLEAVQKSMLLLQDLTYQLLAYMKEREAHNEVDLNAVAEKAMAVFSG